MDWIRNPHDHDPAFPCFCLWNNACTFGNCGHDNDDTAPRFQITKGEGSK